MMGLPLQKHLILKEVKMAIKLFISDVHLGAGRYSEESKNTTRYPYDWDWLSLDETENFMNFIRFVHTGYDRKIEEVVLLGDIFDNWVFPYDLVPPTMEELFEAEKNKRVIRELNTLATKTKVYYIPGNHDMHATAAVMKDFFPDFIYCPKRYSSDRLIAEHGHRYAMFNAPARFSTNIMGLPLGYFISRTEATKKAMTNSEGRSYHTYVDDFIEMFGEQTLPQSVLEAVIEEAGFDEEIEYKIKRKNGQVLSKTAIEVKDVYKNIYRDWPTSTVSRPRAVFAELDMLGPIADKLCKDGLFKVCIFGHSHKSEIDRDIWFVNDRIYANTGYWCGSECTFIEAEKTDDGYDVGIVKWAGNDRIERKERESI
jgi:UDP-2,3-diacylglucosamine pyrophosphatase LpxH